jgi:predicted nuclease with TOPRIM domain
MADEDDNIVLRLLREIRGKLDDHDRAFEGLQGRMVSIERHMEDVKESVGYALGLSAHANVAYETTGQRLDRLTERVDGLEARIEQLEKPQ